MKIPEQRVIKLKQLFKKEKIMTVEEACRNFNVSPLTIRRDITKLEKEGFLRKVHGGAIYNEIIRENIIESLPNFSKQYKLFKKEKNRIGKEASKRIKDNYSITLESGSTCLSVVKYLKAKNNLKVSTAGISIQLELWKLSLIKRDINIGVCGGIINSSSSIFTGPHALNFFNIINNNIAFISGTAVSVKKGISTASIEDSEITRAVAKSANKVILLADSSKFEKYSFINVMALKELDEIITDKNIDQDIVTDIKKMGIKITIV
ncbi:DeoR/GlpR family DNA-binding transcription regulator [Actinomycetota bacterium]